MPDSDNSGGSAGKSLLPVAIMAHNEEKVIRSAIESVLSQDVPKGYEIKVVVAANGCSDITEDIVRQLSESHPGRVELLSVTEKGKTMAINATVQCLSGILQKGGEIPYVVFLDADCVFADRDALVCLVGRFEKEPLLCAVGADCVPDVVVNGRDDVIAEMYRAVYEMSCRMGINALSGMCYGIRFDVLTKMDFPVFQIAEDMYASARLNGCFVRDKDIRIIFNTPPDVRSEVRRRLRQEVSAQRYRDYYHYLRSKGSQVKLFSESLGPDYRWGRNTDHNVLRAWYSVKGIRMKLLILFSLVIRIYSRARSLSILREVRKNHGYDYWEVSR
jgi:glycosyltransferase involved in cell wall biosynthesis